MAASVKEREGTLVNSRKVKLNIFAFCTVLIWATAFPLTKMIGDEFSANSLGLIRCVVAAITLIIMGLAARIQKPVSKQAAVWLFFSGLLGFALYLIFFTTGISTLTSATSSIIIAATPVMTAIGASRIYHDKIKPAGWLCIGCAFTGVVVLLLWNGALSINIGVVWTLAAAFVFCIYNLMNRKLSSMGHSAMEIVTYSMIFGALAMMVFLPQTLDQFTQASFQAILLAVYLGVAPSAIAYLLWAKAMEYAERTSEVTNYMFVTPLLATVLGFIILGELPDIGTLIGGIIIIVSVIMFNKVGK